ncbi:reverse transcriptase domain-containing protein [Tanacetum coccineum]
MDQMLGEVESTGNELAIVFSWFFLGYFQIPIDPSLIRKYNIHLSLQKHTPTVRMLLADAMHGKFPKGVCGYLQYMIEKHEVITGDFLVFGNSFENCLSHVDKMLQRCEDTNLCLNWEKSHFMVKEGIVLGHKISKKGIEVDKGKVDVIAKLPHPTTVKGVRSFLDHAAFQMLKKKLTEAPILIALDWDFPFELMCDASDFVIGFQGEIAPVGSPPSRVHIQSQEAVDILQLTILDPPGDITVPTTPPKKFLTQDFIGP